MENLTIRKSSNKNCGALEERKKECGLLINQINSVVFLIFF